MNITDQQVKELVNSLIDLTSKNSNGFTDEQMSFRKLGIELAIIKINSRLLHNGARNEADKYELDQQILKTA